jgi:hypothetical protein
MIEQRRPFRRLKPPLGMGALKGPAAPRSEALRASGGDVRFHAEASGFMGGYVRFMRKVSGVAASFRHRNRTF